MEDECEKMKKRISQINAIIAQHKQGTEVEMEELDDFEINTECMAFSKQDTHEKQSEKNIHSKLVLYYAYDNKNAQKQKTTREIILTFDIF